jgi:hypothetical protein
VTARRCPTCRGESRRDGNKLWPFCSERCHLVDLGRWLAEDYRVPVQSEDDAAPVKLDNND